MAGCAQITALTLLLLPTLISSSLKWPLLVIMGTAGYGVYTVSLVALGNRFSGIELINGSASFAVIWGFGARLRQRWWVDAGLGFAWFATRPCSGLSGTGLRCFLAPACSAETDDLTT
jgi:hypothetical protein